MLARQVTFPVKNHGSEQIHNHFIDMYIAILLIVVIQPHGESKNPGGYSISAHVSRNNSQILLLHLEMY